MILKVKVTDKIIPINDCNKCIFNYDTTYYALKLPLIT